MTTRSLAGLLGPGAHHEGSLVFQGRVRIDGTLLGDVQSDDFLEIGPQGHIEGSVNVAQALVAGRIEGALRARERITLLETAVVMGQITTPWLDVRPGAQLRATVRVDRSEEDDE